MIFIVRLPHRFHPAEAGEAARASFADETTT
jgi:hypothetical protein